MSIRIATSRRGRMRALGSQGIFATDCHEQLASLLQQHLGPEHAALLAEPQHGADGQDVDWYAEGPGPAVPLADLPEDEARILRAKIAALATDILELSRRMTAEAQAQPAPGQSQALSGQLLALALQHPSDEDILSVGGRPVLVNWGFAPGSPGAVPQDLSRLGAWAPTPPSQQPVAAVPIPPGGGCLPWLLPLLLLLLLAWLLASVAGLLPSPLPAGCTHVDRSALDAEMRKQAEHEEALRLLWQQLQERAALCKPAPPPEEKKPEPVLPEPEAVPEREPEPEPEQKPEVIEPFLGESPLEEPREQPAPEKPKPEPKPEPREKPKPAPAKNEDLNIPEDAAKKNDLSFLEGCWTSETGLFSHPSNEPIIAEYCFDKNGKGRRFVRERNGQVCSGSARARFQGNRLQFDANPANCPRGGKYVPQKVDCTGSENTTQCKGKELGGTNRTWDARFKRK